MSKESNAYIVTFSIGMILVIAIVLGLVKEFTKDAQRQAVELDTQKQILSAIVPLDKIGQTGAEINAYYEKHIESIAVDVNGDEKTTNQEGEKIIPEKVSIRKEFKKKEKSEKILPVFKFKDDAGKVTAYILPVYGNGLWDNIWGYIALEPDMKTVKGAVFDHKGETPGLGARIADSEVENRYKGKTVSDETGKLVGIQMIKGEGNVEPGALTKNEVDGLSGATITARGVNAMLENYLGLYENYIQKVKKSSADNSSELEEIALVK
ncbi:NADH:ubiquinone reductase (Na(+)-transporting) subunit C [Bernardetia sp.]|uniref:NADH:ubiquinone reductase (Na(+)-transporting) subunit C n=1 Tax=Bernardetia sp. TaxID=1937974 RepID=UPI0025C4A1E7|nr:NADH:ubiquinone reductase (Na(+)-transporting) subunit C [Bernardetia sp.]